MISEHGNAKINLTMDVLSRRDDGYHDVRTVMHSVAFGDTVSVTQTAGRGVKFLSNVPYLPSDDRNHAVKAVKLFLREAKLSHEFTLSRINVNCAKRIPVCGGLGGSSADSAAVLKLMNRLCGEPFTLGELVRLSAMLGSDVPFCVAGGSALCEGVGDLITPLPTLPECSIVIVKPEFSGVTAELFAAIDSGKIRAHPDTDGLISALELGDLPGVARRIFNVFEDVLPPHHARQVSDAKGRLLDLGALGASMSGSGSAVFALFDDRKLAKSAFLTLREEGIECYLTTPTNPI